MWRNLWMGLTERWPALWVTTVFYKALMQTWNSSEWPEWTTTFPEWMECRAEHRAWPRRVQAPYWCFTRCTAVSNALPGPTPQLLLFHWLKKKKKAFTSFRSSLRLPQRPWVFCTRHCQVGGIQGNSFIFGSVDSTPLFGCSQKEHYTQPNLSISQQWTHSWPLSTPRQLSTSVRIMGLSTLYLLHLAPRVSSSQSIHMLQRNLSPPCISLSLSVSSPSLSYSPQGDDEQKGPACHWGLLPFSRHSGPGIWLLSSSWELFSTFCFSVHVLPPGPAPVRYQ